MMTNNSIEHKAKQFLKHGATTHQEQTCVYCKDPITQHAIYIGQEKYRHIRCEPGLARWANSEVAKERVAKGSATAQLLMQQATTEKEAEMGTKKNNHQKEKSAFGHRPGTERARMDKHILEGGTIAQIAVRAKVRQGRLKYHLSYLRRKRGVPIEIDANNVVTVKQ